MSDEPNPFQSIPPGTDAGGEEGPTGPVVIPREPAESSGQGGPVIIEPGDWGHGAIAADITVGYIETIGMVPDWGHAEVREAPSEPDHSAPDEERSR